MTDVTITPLGEDGLMALPSDRELIQSFAAHLLQSALWEEVVPGLDSVGVIYNPLSFSVYDATLRLKTQWEELGSVPSLPSEKVTIPVRYGGEFGPDLEAVCQLISMTPEDFIMHHTSKPFPVKMVGFAPGFAYIGDLGIEAEIPRLDTPRPHVPAGSVAVAAGHTGLYPMDGPGGWRLIGRTNRTLFDANHDDPFLLSAGDQVEFKAIPAL